MKRGEIIFPFNSSSKYDSLSPMLCICFSRWDNIHTGWGYIWKSCSSSRWSQVRNSLILSRHCRGNLFLLYLENTFPSVNPQSHYLLDLGPSHQVVLELGTQSSGKPMFCVWSSPPANTCYTQSLFILNLWSLFLPAKPLVNIQLLL